MVKQAFAPLHPAFLHAARDISAIIRYQGTENPFVPLDRQPDCFKGLYVLINALVIPPGERRKAPDARRTCAMEQLEDFEAAGSRGPKKRLQALGSKTCVPHSCLIA